MTVVELTIADAEFIAFELAKEMMGGKEPFPDFSTRPPHKLEAVLAAPFASFAGEEQYPTIAEKAAALFYSCCKDHPLQNGNKRMAVVLLVVFLFINHWWIAVDPVDLYNKAKQVASSQSRSRKKVMSTLVTFIEEGIVPLKDAPLKQG